MGNLSWLRCYNIQPGRWGWSWMQGARERENSVRIWFILYFWGVGTDIWAVLVLSIWQAFNAGRDPSMHRSKIKAREAMPSTLPKECSSLLSLWLLFSRAGLWFPQASWIGMKAALTGPVWFVATFQRDRIDWCASKNKWGWYLPPNAFVFG